jgi:hypothetical protein
MSDQQLPYVRRGRRIRAFVITSLLSVITALIFFALIVQVDLLDGALYTLLKGVAWFKPVMALAAASPLFAALLVGYGYMDRAIKRRAREAQAQSS